MSLKEIISHENMIEFIKLCNQDSFDNYEPYIDFDALPCPVQIKKDTPLLGNSGIRLYRDKNTTALYLLSHSNELIGFCSAFSYVDKDSNIVYELSVIIEPAYRRHRLGTFMLSEMISAITALHKNLLQDDVTHGCSAFLFLVGSNEYFAQRNGFEYSHSEHFMQRESFSMSKKNTCSSFVLKSSCWADCGSAIRPAQNAFTENASTENTSTENASTENASTENVFTENTFTENASCTLSVQRRACSEQGHYVYRLFSDGTSAARCTIYECSDYINIANVYTNKAFRGRGLAGCLIGCAAKDFPDKKLLLQVSGSNTAAIHAYTKAGFEFIKTYDYYKAEL